jgi:hypothetical protein
MAAPPFTKKSKFGDRDFGRLHQRHYLDAGFETELHVVRDQHRCKTALLPQGLDQLLHFATGMD